MSGATLPHRIVSERLRPLARVVLVLLSVWGGVACDRKTVQDPFARQLQIDAGSVASPPGDGGSDDDLLIVDDEGLEHQESDPSLGGRCLSDSQCDDGVECTADECDTALGRCRFTAQDEQCQDGAYCNGAEVCVLGLGCRPGEPITCDDGSPCTIDRCIEETRECERLERDVDGDGDPDAHCVERGGDCNDLDPAISSLQPEVCGNLRDDDCDGSTDEADCSAPHYDDCSVALVVSAPTSERLTLDAVKPDTAASCSEIGARDLAIDLDVQEAADVVITIRGDSDDFAVALRGDCGEETDELACAVAVAQSDDEALARVLLRASKPGHYGAIVFKQGAGELELSVDFLEPTEAAGNETCEGASPLVPGQSVSVQLLGAEADHATRCDAETGAGDLVYRFTLDEPHDVRVAALPSDPGMAPVLALRSAGCASIDDELACVEKDAAELFARSLEAGTYYVVVSAAVAGQLDLLLLLDDPSEPPPGESCDDPRSLLPGQLVSLPLDGYADDVVSSCLVSGRDAVLSLQLEQASDVLVKQRLTRGDTGAVALLDASCDGTEPLACVSGQDPPLRAVSHALPAGVYHVVSESLRANPVSVFAAVRPARPAIIVAGADTCDEAELIPEIGGLFTGNTGAAYADYTSSCDVANVTPGGAPDQILRLDLSERSRVILDGSDSRFSVLLNLRRGPECPGTEIFGGCANIDDNGSYIENVLDAGTYYVQVDGYAGRSGQWALEVFVLPEP